MRIASHYREKCIALGKLTCMCICGIATSAMMGQAGTPQLSDACVMRLSDRPVTVVVPSRPGGGYDTYARAIASEMEHTIGYTVRVINVGGAGGAIALAQVEAQSDDEILIYINDIGSLVNSTDTTASLGFGSDAFEILSVFLSEPETWLATENLDLVDPDLSQLIFSTTSLGSNLVPIALASDVLGLTVQIVPGYDGSAESTAAVMRGETDLTTASLSSARKSARSSDLEPVMVISDGPAKQAPDLPYLLGPGSVFDRRSVNWSEAERTQKLELGKTVVTLATTRRALFTAATVDEETLSCLRVATDLTLSSERLAAQLEQQRRPLDPQSSEKSRQIFTDVRQAFAENRDVIRAQADAFGQ